MADSQQPHLASQFGFVQLTVKKLSFLELQKQELEEGEESPKKVPISLTIALGTRHNAEQRLCEVSFEVTAEPDPRFKPYRVEIMLVGTFSIAEGQPLDDLDSFATTAAPVILWPYVREAVHRVTMDGRYGTLLMDPMYIAPILSQGIKAKEQEGGERKEE